MADNSYDDPAINRKILKMLDDAIEKMKPIKPYGFFSKQLIGLRRRFGSSLRTTTPEEEAILHNNEAQVKVPGCTEDEKLVFFRLFHRDMNRLEAGKPWLLPWLKPLLEGIKICEKRGLAVYGSEDEARRGTRSRNYCYVGVKIDKSQDITARRGTKIDTVLGCPLLIIADMNQTDIYKLHYGDLDFPIVDGEILAPIKVVD